MADNCLLVEGSLNWLSVNYNKKKLVMNTVFGTSLGNYQIHWTVGTRTAEH